MDTRNTELTNVELNDHDVEAVSGGIIPLLALGVGSALLGYNIGRDLARR